MVLLLASKIKIRLKSIPLKILTMKCHACEKLNKFSNFGCWSKIHSTSKIVIFDGVWYFREWNLCGVIPQIDWNYSNFALFCKMPFDYFTLNYLAFEIWEYFDKFTAEFSASRNSSPINRICMIVHVQE